MNIMFLFNNKQISKKNSKKIENLFTKLLYYIIINYKNITNQTLWTY